MHFSELIARINAQYGPALKLRDFVRREKRLALERGFFLVSVLLLFLTATAFALKWSSNDDVPYADMVVRLGDKMWGLFLITFTITFILNALEAMHRSYYFIGLNEVLTERAGTTHHTDVPVGWGVATIVSHTDPNDITGGFLNATLGQEILYRAGVSEKAFADFVDSRKPVVTAASFIVDRDAGIMLSTYVKSLLKFDKALTQFLAHERVSELQCIEAARWVSWIEQSERRKARWWSRDNLGRIPGIGKTWGYGETYLLSRYGHDLVDDHAWGGALMTQHAEEDEVEAIEQVLARARQSNALIIGEDLVACRQKLMQLYQKIRSGTALPPIEGKLIYYVDLEAMSSALPESSGFETMFDRLMTQAMHAGNIIVYFENIEAAVQSIRTRGVDLVERMMPYLESSVVQIVASVTPDGWNGKLERDSRILQTFDVVRMHEVSSTGLLDVLKQRALAIERQTGVVYCIPALETVIRLADQYFPTGVMPDKAFDLLEELAPMALSAHKKQLVTEDVERLVAGKTGIPVGTPTREESEKLLKLEEFMHKRVVGQERAVSAVAKALRRSRAGISGHNRPMGSFLFLGPTGVGKTETAKALAEALFGSENAMSRIDMTEFQGSDALEQLIGSSSGTPGRLATLARERPYGVLLLDEFEKSSRTVHDLFLQVLDEGRFSDAAGKVVNVRNMIIIATSNAGADLVWQWEQEGKNVVDMKRALIDELVRRSTFRPEFLNRFDDVIVFHALGTSHVHAIAENQLEALKTRLRKERNIDVSFSPDLVEYVASAGFDPQFGGRPMRRVIQDAVEQAVADSVLRGTIASGSTLTITRADVEKSAAA